MDFNHEAVVQWGTFDHRRILAWGLSSDTGYTFSDRFNVRVGVRADHDPRSQASSNPLDAHLHTLAVPLYVHNDPFDNLANDLFAIGIGGGWSSPKHGNIRRQAANSLSFGFRKDAWLVLNKPMILLLKLLLGN